MNRLCRLFFLGVLVLGARSLAGAQTSAQAAGYLYLSPVPGAPYCAPETRYILVRFKNISPDAVTNLTADFINVTGSITGDHPGTAHVATDGRTVIYEMEKDFSEQDLVTVTLNPQLAPGSSRTVEKYVYQFMVAGPMPGAPIGAKASSLPNPGDPPETLALPVQTGTGTTVETPRKTAVVLDNGVAVPSDFPQSVITVNNNPSPGYLFLENGISVPPYTMILDNNGAPVWYRRGRMYDFKVQQNGTITWCTADGLGFPAFDENFNYLQTYKTVNGYLTEGHDLRVLADGSYIMIGYRNNLVDMSLYVQDGSTSSVRETVVQQFTAAGELILQWRAWDNYDIRDSGTDFPHMNALAIDDDGNLLVSARHLSEITKINRDTGEIIWRLSGAHSSFSFVNDPFNGTSYQHHVTALGKGRYLCFDNGNYRPVETSRAVEYQLDLTNMTATITWQYRDTPDKYTYYLGSAHRQPDGNTLINFVRAQYPKVIEVDRQGQKRFELSLVPGSDAYRAFRFPWNGVVAAPYLVVEPQPDRVVLIFNKFGDTNVSYYRVHAGTSATPTTVIGTSVKPLMELSHLENGVVYYFRVTAVDHQGVESEYSNEENLQVNIFATGQNMVVNGDFTNGTKSWRVATSGGASAIFSVTNGAAHVQIAAPGSATSSIRLSQTGCALIQGRKYVLEFDAWADAPRYITPKVGQLASPYTVYHQESPYLTPLKNHFKYMFTMRQASDYATSVFLDLGASTSGVYLQNISLFTAATGDVNTDGVVDFRDLQKLAAAWLKQPSDPSLDFKSDSKVDFLDFGVLGADWSVKEWELPTDTY